MNIDCSLIDQLIDWLIHWWVKWQQFDWLTVDFWFEVESNFYFFVVDWECKALSWRRWLPFYCFVGRWDCNNWLAGCWKVIVSQVSVFCTVWSLSQNVHSLTNQWLQFDCPLDGLVRLWQSLVGPCISRLKIGEWVFDCLTCCEWEWSIARFYGDCNLIDWLIDLLIDWWLDSWLSDCNSRLTADQLLDRCIWLWLIKVASSIAEPCL